VIIAAAAGAALAVGFLAGRYLSTGKATDSTGRRLEEYDCYPFIVTPDQLLRSSKGRAQIEIP